MPTDAQNATILELSADMIPHSGAVVRPNFIFSAVSPLESRHLSHEAQGKSRLYSILPGGGDISRGILGIGNKIQKPYMVPLIQSLNCNSFMWRKCLMLPVATMQPFSKAIEPIIKSNGAT